jgi:hypothetical protein
VLVNRLLEKMMTLDILPRGEVKMGAVTFKELPGTTYTTAFFEGDSTAVEEAVQKYFKDYIPAGYSTRILRDEEENGYRKVSISRYSNCD